MAETAAPTPTPRQAREAAGFSGADGLRRLSKLVGRSEATLRKIDRGYCPPEIVLRRLCRVLGCSYSTYLLPAPCKTVGRPSRGGRKAKTTRSRRGPQTTRREPFSPSARSGGEGGAS